MSAEKVAAKTAETGISAGVALATCISWSVNHSILWAIFQGACSWGYVIYYAVKR